MADANVKAIAVPHKTNRLVQFELTVDVRASPIAWLERRGGALADFLFPSRVDHANHMSTRQHARLVDEWITAIGMRKGEHGVSSRPSTNSWRSH